MNTSNVMEKKVRGGADSVWIGLSQAGKKTGNFQNWYNIKYTHHSTIAGNTENIDLSAIKDLTIIDKTSTMPDNQTTDDIFIAENLTHDDAKIR